MDRKQLLEIFAQAHKFDGLPPLANKVIGAFYLTDNKYLSFDEIIELVESSKGAVSKVLKLLINIHRVQYIPDPKTPRKRLFYLDPKGGKGYIQEVVQGLNMQTEMIKQFQSMRSEHAAKDISELIQSTIAFNEETIKFLLKSSKKYYE
ncbi:hypothetical protein [Flammeovirga pacifica]|uniref:HTH marR-type domain-containing protein n=1 Tax=Flammeovirga pacifica TaxID=915059 RepID=A0A1S1YU52_FLAPC|nr:hypothetical protein [Flammeovirga pacifica]OHX64549.1 hypothetical protein NH26_23540 [Flammeovirga pacifica]